ncbi:MAG: hypothetical protein LBB21_00090 [Holosporaceae bacterium]|jgi:hypothetical protein|nr:hypothetical protein [Holosporaceae bacterium]
MNVNVDELEKKHFTIEDIVSYSNIEITNANDNRPPMKIIALRVVVVCVVAALIGALFLI